MPTIIESLLFEIGIDTKKLGGDAKEVETHLRGVEDRSHKAVQELEERGKQSGAMFKGLKEEAGGFFAMIAGAYSAQKIAGMSKDIMLNAESLGMMSSNLGMATERLKTWQLAAEKNGGSTGSMNGLLNQAAMVAAATKRGEDFAGSQEFFGLGGKREDLQSSEAYLMAVSRIVKAQYGQSEQAGLYSANALSVPPDLVFLLKQGPDAIRAILQEQEKYANVSDAWAKAAHDTLNSFRDVGGSLTKIGTIMLESVNPEFRKMSEYAERAAEAVVREKAALKENTPIMLNEAGAAVTGKAVGKKIVVTGGSLAGKLAGKSMNLGWLGGPVGAVVSDMLFPRSTVSKDQEAAAMRQWQAEHAAGGGASERDKVRATERANNIPSGLMDAIWLQESTRGENPAMGESGPWQITKTTGAAYGLSPQDRLDPDKSREVAAKILVDNYKRLGSWDAATASYNDGDPNTPKAQRYLEKIKSHLESGRAGRYAEESANYVIPPNPTGVYTDQSRDRMPAASSTSNRTDIQVNGPITIQTQSTDPEGIKKEFADTMGSYSNIASMAETGTH